MSLTLDARRWWLAAVGALIVIGGAADADAAQPKRGRRAPAAAKAKPAKPAAAPAKPAAAPAKPAAAPAKPAAAPAKPTPAGEGAAAKDPAREPSKDPDQQPEAADDDEIEIDEPAAAATSRTHAPAFTASPAASAPAPSTLVAATSGAAMGPSDDPRASAAGIFYSDKLDTESSVRHTLYQGSLTSTTMLFHEAASRSDKRLGGQVDYPGASPFSRFFTDVRAQADAKHIFGGRWDARVDARVRVTNSATTLSNNIDSTVRLQSGTYGGNEYDVRELYAVRAGEKLDVFVGRQYVLDLAGVKIDGARAVYALRDRLDVFAMAGLYPVRGSRSIDTDYPAGVDAMNQPAKRVLPVATGAGAAYRTSLAYGALGAVGILPLGTDNATGATEKPRVFVTSNGYWRTGPRLDVYHYMVFDLAGADGIGFTNGSVGVNWTPGSRLHVTAAAHHVDTETLNIQAQTLLETPAPGDEGGVVHNNVTVLRIASDQVRAGVSVALGAAERFELSTQAAARWRGDIDVPLDGGMQLTIPGTRGGELTLQAVDRRALLGLRVSGSVSYFFPLGGDVTTNYYKSKSLATRLAASRDFADGRGDAEVEVGFLYAEDANLAATCDPTKFFQGCYGSSQLRIPSLGATASYRFAKDWFALASLWASYQILAVTDAMSPVTQPAILSTTGLFRVAYRF